jgi:hypothetical protein
MATQTILDGMVADYLSHGSREPQIDETTGLYIDPEFDGLCRKLADVLKGRQVTHGKEKVVRTVTRVTIREDGATITATCDRKTKVSDLGRRFTVLTERDTGNGG